MPHLIPLLRMKKMLLELRRRIKNRLSLLRMKKTTRSAACIPYLRKVSILKVRKSETVSCRLPISATSARSQTLPRAKMIWIRCSRPQMLRSLNSCLTASLLQASQEGLPMSNGIQKSQWSLFDGIALCSQRKSVSNLLYKSLLKKMEKSRLT